MQFFGTFYHPRNFCKPVQNDLKISETLRLYEFYKITRNDEKNTISVLVALLQKYGVFGTFLNFHVKYTPWRWCHSKNLMWFYRKKIFMGTLKIYINGFALFDKKPNQHLFWEKQNAIFWAKRTDMNGPCSHRNSRSVWRLSKLSL